MKNYMRSLLAGFLVGASVLITPLKSFSESEKIFDQNFPVLMYHENGRKFEESLKIEAFYDDETKKLTLSYFSGTYNRENWNKIEQRSSLDERYTELSDGGTRIYLLRPHEVTVSNVKEKAWIVKQDTSGKIHQGFMNLTSMEEHPYLQQMFTFAGKAWDIIMKEIGVKDLTKVFNEFEKEIKSNEKQEPKNIINEVNENYSITRILPYPIDFWDVATARTYDIYLNTDLKKKEVPLSLWLKIALGDPTNGSTVKNRHGELEGIVINFTLNQKKEVQISGLSSIENYFPKPTEKEKFGLIPAKLEILGEGTSSQIDTNNPFFFDKDFLNKYEPSVNAKGIASYSISTNEESDEIGFYMEVYNLNSKKVLESFKTRAHQYSDLAYFGLAADNLFVCFDSFMNYENRNGKLATKEQALNYLNFIINYKKRINAKEVVMNKEDRKSIKSDFEKNPTNILDRINNPRDYGFKTTEEAIRYLFSPLN